MIQLCANHIFFFKKKKKRERCDCEKLQSYQKVFVLESLFSIFCWWFYQYRKNLHNDIYHWKPDEDDYFSAVFNWFIK